LASTSWANISFFIEEVHHHLASGVKWPVVDVVLASLGIVVAHLVWLCTSHVNNTIHTNPVGLEFQVVLHITFQLYGVDVT
jgi:glycopeptide antibiotics resistance protein